MSVQVNFGDLGGWGLDLLAYLSAQIGAADGAAGFGWIDAGSIDNAWGSKEKLMEAVDSTQFSSAAEAVVCGRSYARAMAAAG